MTHEEKVKLYAMKTFKNAFFDFLKAMKAQPQFGLIWRLTLKLKKEFLFRIFFLASVS